MWIPKGAALICVPALIRGNTVVSIFCLVENFRGRIYRIFLRSRETTTGRVLLKKAFWNLSQNSQENTCVGVSGQQLHQKRDIDSCFPLNFAEFVRTPFHRTLLLDPAYFYQSQIYSKTFL